MNSTNGLNPFVQMLMNAVHNFCDFHSNTWNHIFLPIKRRHFRAIWYMSDSLLSN